MTSKNVKLPSMKYILNGDKKDAPSHPGVYLKEILINQLNLTVTEAAQHLCFSRVQLSRTLNGRSGITPLLAKRLQEAGIDSAFKWMALQIDYDLWKVGKERIQVADLIPAKRKKNENIL